MPRWSTSSAPAAGAPWLAFAAGIAAGLAGGILLGRRTERSPGMPSLARAWEGASRRMEAMAEGLREPLPVDLEALRARLAALPGGEGLRLRALTEGIVEVVGTAPDAERARAVLDVLSREPGVRAVVNRVWTPSSAAPGDD